MISFPRTHIPALITLLLSLGFMIPGWILPFMHVRAEVNMLFFNSEIWNETRSIFGTISDLYEGHFFLAASLLLFFGICIPLLKSMALLFLIFSNKNYPRLLFLINQLNKWAMADVFAISILIAFLVFKSMSSADLAFQVELKSGFYCFVAYVICGGIASGLLPKSPSDKS